ncbi:MAG: hypothetical protein ACJA10_001141 [Oleispira sp.]
MQPCHSNGLGANTNEKIARLDEIGRFFTPTIFQKEVESICATFLRDVYRTQSRFLMHVFFAELYLVSKILVN